MLMRYIVITFLCLAIAFGARAQAPNFKQKQKSQEKTIKAAQKYRKISDREYEKLMKEQYLIQAAIEKAEIDGVWTAHEKNAIHDKLVRAEKRLTRYKTNGEIY